MCEVKIHKLREGMLCLQGMKNIVVLVTQISLSVLSHDEVCCCLYDYNTIVSFITELHRTGFRLCT